MSEMCSFAMLVRGKKNSCYAFVGSGSYEDYEIDSAKEVEDGLFELSLSGAAKGSLDGGWPKKWNGEMPGAVPEDAEKALEFGFNYCGYTVKDRSKMFGVEVWANSGILDYYEDEEFDDEEEDDDDDSDGIVADYEHYINGEVVNDKCPKWLLLYRW